MAILKAQVALHHDNNIVADDCVNTFHFLGAATSGLAEDLTTVLETFYNAIEVIFSSSLTGIATVKWYDVDVLPSGPPFYVEDIAFTPGSGPGLPNEVALCLSYQADFTPGFSQANRRGRIFLGPLDQDVCADEVPQRPAGSVLTLIAGAGEQLVLDADAAGAIWAVYSPTLGVANEITNGWCDNAFDTIRKRGEVATARVVFP